MNTLRTWFANSATTIRTSLEKRRASEYAVCYDGAPGTSQRNVRLIDPTGMYVAGDHRWSIGATIPLTLLRKPTSRLTDDRRLEIDARLVSADARGADFEFVLPSGMETKPWTDLCEKAATMTEPDDLLGQLRLAHACAFLRSVCPSAEIELRRLAQCKRIANAVGAVLEAKKLMAKLQFTQRFDVPDHAIVKVLQQGSRAGEVWHQQMWAGLLVSTCGEANVGLSLEYVHLFAQLSPVHARIFKAICERSSTFLSGSGFVLARPVLLELGDIATIAHKSDLESLTRDLSELASVNVIAGRARFDASRRAQEFNLTPTDLGLHLFARCNGHAGTLQQFFGL